MRTLLLFKLENICAEEIYVSFDNAISVMQDSNFFVDVTCGLKGGTCNERRICNVGYDDYKGGVAGLFHGLSYVADRAFFVWYFACY